MIGHILKMLWQERKKYAGVLMEQVLIFIILMVSMVALFGAIDKYREPGLLNTDDVVVFGYMLHGGGNGSQDDMRDVGQGMNIIIENMFFGIVISLIAFELGKIIYNKTKLPIFNPLLTSIIIVIVILKIFNIDFELYNKGGQFINMFLGPATVILAVPLYKQLLLLKKNFVPIIIGISIGSVVSVISVILLSTVFNLDKEIIISLIPKSVTTPIGVEISNSLGGITGITVMAVILTGITGAIIAPTVCKIFKINNPVARGIGIGTASHAVGTSKALEIGETEGAMSSLSIGIAGLITVVVAPICLDILTKLL